MATLPSLNLNYQGTEVLYAEAAIQFRQDGHRCEGRTVESKHRDRTERQETWVGILPPSATSHKT